MVRVVHILGASGSGTTTLGRALSDAYGYHQLDSDDYFWLPTEIPYTVKRGREERVRLMREAIEPHEKCVITGSLCGWGDPLIPLFGLIVRVVTPTEVRLARLQEREYAKFGGRIREGGDMFQAHLEFLQWAADYDAGGLDMRSRAAHDAWLAQPQIRCPVAEADGTRPLPELLAALAPFLEET